MRLLDRYLLRELLWPLVFCLSGFLVFLTCFDLFSRLDKFHAKQLLAGDIAEYYAVRTPEFLVVILPVALLLSLLYALTNHARHHELTAIRGAGVSLWRMCVPYFAVGLAASLLLGLINEFWAPDVESRAEAILNRHTQPQVLTPEHGLKHNLGFTNGRDGRKWQIGTYNLLTCEMTDPKVDWHTPDGCARELVAKRAVWTNGAWAFFDVLEHMYAPGSSQITNRLLLPTLVATNFTETPEIIKSEIRISERLSSARAARTADLPIADLVDYLRLHPNLPHEDLAWLRTRLQARLAAPWTCLVVVLIAIPFGAASGRRNVFVGVASSIVICFAYFVFQQAAMAVGSGGYVAPWLAAWAPNLTAATVGFWLTCRTR
jgi:lipopolysaccharide export system permease protein